MSDVQTCREHSDLVAAVNATRLVADSTKEDTVKILKALEGNGKPGLLMAADRTDRWIAQHDEVVAEHRKARTRVIYGGLAAVVVGVVTFGGGLLLVLGVVAWAALQSFAP